jgi:oxygen-dependent protoporphyrinogen oxidase
MSMAANLPELYAMEKQSGSLAAGFGKKIFLGWLNSKSKASTAKLAGPKVTERVTSQEGSQGLINALAHELKLRGVRIQVSHSITALFRDTNYRISYESQLGKGEEAFDSVISCVPSYGLAPLVTSWPKNFQAFLTGIPHAPLVLAHVGLSKTDSPQGFTGEGCLVQAKAGDGILSVFMASRMVPKRSLDTMELVRVLLGGGRRTNMVFLSGAAIQNFAVHIIRKIFKPTGELKVFPCIRHSRGLPQLVVGHAKSLDALKRWLNSEWPGFYLAGTSLEGAGIEKAVTSGKNAATRAAQFFGWK